MASKKSMDRKSVLIFGVGELQLSIINRAKAMGLFIVGIDPCEDAYAKNACDAFEVVGGQDYDGTLAVAEKYGISAVVTAATDKPLVMMARIAKTLSLPFYSVETAVWSTDKYQMKARFIEGGVPCAQGRLIHNADEAKDLTFPVICKPRDNSGSRGVKLCRSLQELQECIDEALQYSHLDTVLVEEYIEGREFSIESLHYRGKSEVIQFTEKKTTEFPYNVELGHKQPANLTESQRAEIREIISKIASCLNFENCASHTELKVNDRGIFVIETSPRLGGDYITSTLTPFSTGINLEDQLLHIALGEPVDTISGRVNKASAVCFFSFPVGTVKSISAKIEEAPTWPNVQSFDLKLKVGDKVNQITSSLNRYGEFIVAAENRAEIDPLVDNYEKRINSLVTIE
jgi:biotin carboxylase